MEGRKTFESVPACLYCVMGFFTDCGGMLSKTFADAHFVECAGRVGLQIGQIEVQSVGLLLPMGCCYFTGVDRL